MQTQIERTQSEEQLNASNYQSLEQRVYQNNSKNMDLDDIDRLIAERYSNNPSLANKEAFVNMGKNMVKSFYYGLTGFMFIPTAFRRDGKLRYYFRSIRNYIKTSNMYDSDFEYRHLQRESMEILEKSVRIEDPYHSFFNSAGAISGISYGIIGGIADLGCYMSDKISGKTALGFALPIIGSIASVGYEILRKWFLYERDKVISKYTKINGKTKFEEKK